MQLLGGSVHIGGLGQLLIGGSRLDDYHAIFMDGRARKAVNDRKDVVLYHLVVIRRLKRNNRWHGNFMLAVYFVSLQERLTG